jgi:hypothetical protein
MNQFDPNPTTWYLIVPLLVLGLAALVWLVAKLHVSMWQRVALSIVGVFAFVGFATGVLCVYYHTNEPFNAMFKFYAYSKLAPDADPFASNDKTLMNMLVQLEGHIKDGQVYVAKPPASLGYDFMARLFTNGAWQAVGVKDYNVQQLLLNGQPDITATSLWWALTNDPFKLTATAQ